MNKEEISLLLLDFDGTLIDYKKAEHSAIREVLSKWGIEDVEYAAQRYNVINEGLWARFRKGEVNAHTIRFLRFKTLFDEFGLIRDPVESNAEYLESFIYHSRVDSSVISGIQQLKEAGYLLMVLTNGFHDTQKRRLEQAGILSLLDGYLTSEQVSHPKPSPVMFEVALQKFDLAPQEALMVGDSIEADIAGASAMGIPSVLIADRVPNQPPFPNATFPSFNHFVSFWLNRGLDIGKE